MPALQDLTWRHLLSPGHCVNKTHLFQSIMSSRLLLPCLSPGALSSLLFFCMGGEEEEEGTCGQEGKEVEKGRQKEGRGKEKGGRREGRKGGIVRFL